MKVYFKQTVFIILAVTYTATFAAINGYAFESLTAVTPAGRTVEVSVINANTLKVTNRVGDEKELTANR